MQLVNAILMLSSQIISQTDLETAERLLKLFYVEFSELYGKLCVSILYVYLHVAVR